jgi:TPR repeat protein
MAVLIRNLALTTAALLLAACGAPVDGPEADAAAEAAALDPKAAAEAAKEKAETDKLAAQKPAFDAALAANDTDTIDTLADGGNAWALHHRAVRRIASHDYMLQQGGFEDMEAAAELGLAEALVWVGQRKAYGKDGYKLQPNSGLMMMERAAKRGNLEAMLAVAVMYGQDAYMHDAKKARDWYKRAAEAGSAEAKSVLSQLDGGAPAESETPAEGEAPVEP